MKKHVLIAVHKLNRCCVIHCTTLVKIMRKMTVPSKNMFDPYKT